MAGRVERTHPGTERLLIDRLLMDLMLVHAPSGMSHTVLVYNRSAYMERRRELAEDWADLIMDGADPAGALAVGRRRRVERYSRGGTTAASLEGQRMLPIDGRILDIAYELRRKQAEKGLEHLQAFAADGSEWKASGMPDHVVAPPELEAMYAQPGAGIVYHHSHPDERALSPSDLHLIGKPGVETIWAHAPSGASYGARLRDRQDKRRYLAALDHLHGFLHPEIARGHGVGVDDRSYECLRDFAVMLALERSGWIDTHLSLSDETRRLIGSTGSALAEFVAFATSKTPGT
ncbi:hypothetical protein C8J40_105236 [Sphingomonas sp. PP-CC-3A-396]|nr:hypothetical protein C8J40_105236 [Sphingomonas sp. PP-CC-3A-396]